MPRAKGAGSGAHRPDVIDEFRRRLPGVLRTGVRSRLASRLPPLIGPVVHAAQMAESIAHLDPETTLIHLLVARSAIDRALMAAERVWRQP